MGSYLCQSWTQDWDKEAHIDEAKEVITDAVVSNVDDGITKLEGRQKCPNIGQFHEVSIGQSVPGWILKSRTG